MIFSKYPRCHFQSGILLFWLEIIRLRCSIAKPQSLMQAWLWKKSHHGALAANTHDNPSLLKKKKKREPKSQLNHKN